MIAYGHMLILHRFVLISNPTSYLNQRILKVGDTMAVYSFLVHDPIIDITFKEKLDIVIDHVVKNNYAVEFLFSEYSKGIHICLDTVIQKKKRYPGRVRITWVGPGYAFLDSTKDIDYFFTPPLAPTKVKSDRNMYVEYDRMHRWAVHQADCIITYWYTDLQLSNRLYRYAVQNRAVIDLTEPSTAANIRQDISRLTPEQQRIKKLSDEGISHRLIGVEFGITSSAIRLRIARIVNTLRQYAIARKKQMWLEDYWRKGGPNRG